MKKIEAFQIEDGRIFASEETAKFDIVVKDYDYDEEDKPLTDSSGDKYHGYTDECYVDSALVEKTFKEVK